MPILPRGEAVEEEVGVLDADLPFVDGAEAAGGGGADFAVAAVAVEDFAEVAELEAATIPTTELCALLCGCVTLVDGLAFGKNVC